MVRKIHQLLLFVVCLLLFGVGSGWAAYNYNITIDAPDSVQVDEGGALTFTVSLDQLPLEGDIVEVAYSVTDGTSTVANNDYTAIADGILTFNGSSLQTQTFEVVTTSDPYVEADETILVTYTVTKTLGTSPAPITTNWDNNSTNGTLVNNDYTVTAFADLSVAENIGFTPLIVQLDRAVVGNDVTFAVAHTAGTATAGGTDYIAPSTLLTISAGSDSGTIDIPINDDTLVEPAETFTVTITPSSGNVTVSDPVAEVTITDNDYIVTAFADLSVAENFGSAPLIVQLDRAVVGNDVTFAVAHLAGTATAGGTDYIAPSTLLTISAGSDSGTIDISINDDTLVEPAENFVVTIIPLSGNVTSPYTSAVVTITDNDYIVTAFADVAVLENIGTAQLTVQLDRVVAGNAVKFAVTHTAGTATAGGTDYTAPPVLLTISAGSSYGTINIPINDDTLVEPAEDFVVTISPSSGNVTSPDPDATVTIDITDLYQINISPDFSVDVDAGTATVLVSLNSPIRQAGDIITFDYTTTPGTAVAGTDYTTVSGSITFSDGNPASPKSIIIPILNDGVQTGSKSFTLDLSNISVGLATFIDDSCAVTINDHIFNMTAGFDRIVAEDDGNMVFTVALDRDPILSEVVTVEYTTVDGTALAPGDYSTTSGTLTINSTDTAGDKIITVPITNDTVREISKQFSMVLSNTSVNTLITDDTAIGTITDDDYTVVSFIDVSVAENVGNAALTVQLDRNVAAGDSVTFSVASTSGTATGSGTDYTAPPDLLTIASGSGAGTILIPINDDGLVELVEDFIVSITPTSGNVSVADPNATVGITIDEQYHFSINNVSKLETDTTMDFTVTLVSPTPLQAEHNGLQLIANTQDGTAVAPADYDAIFGEAVTFTDAANFQTLSVTIKSDVLDEGAAEQYLVNLTSSGLYAPIIVFDDSQGVGTIQDTDYIITPTWNLHGSVTLESPPGTQTDITNGSPIGVDSGQQARFTISALYSIQSVVVDGGALPAFVTEVVINGQNRTYTFETTAPQGAHTIEVVFDHEIEMTATGSGTVTHTLSADSVHDNGPTGVLATHGGNSSFSMTADSGNCVTDVIVDSTSIGPFISDNANWDGDSYTFNNVVDNHAIEAQFGSAEITINLGADDGQTGSTYDLFIQDSMQSGSGWRAYTADASYNIGALIKTGVHGETISIPGDTSCDTQYIVIEFLDVDGWLRPANIQISLQNNLTDQVVEGLYGANSHVLTIVSTHGVVTLDPVGSPAVGVERYIYPTGSTVNLVAVADPDWYFQLWQGDASGTNQNFTITMDWDKTVQAVFVQGCQDADNDGYTTADLLGTGCAATPDIDCNDINAEIFPGATEICGDGIDQDCSGADLVCAGADTDNDGDGYTGNQGDCDDNNISIHPGAYDDPDNNIDEDCYDDAKEKGVEVTCSQPSDVPAIAATKPAPPMIMFLLDDSGSMDWEFMTTESNQLFSNRYYVHSYNYRARAYDDTPLSDTQKRTWPSQFTGYNQIYFDAKVAYSPWPKWQDVATAAIYSGSEQGAVTAYEKSYDTDNTSFPDVAFVDGFVHADMDTPRLNTVDSARGHSWSHTSNDGVNLRFDLNAEFLRVKSIGEGQQVSVTRDGNSVPNTSTSSDAIGLSTNPNLELTYGHRWDWYTGATGRVPPEIIFDSNLANWTTDYYSESGAWGNSGGGDQYEWRWETRYTQNSGSFATTRINLTAGQVGNYYVYTWVDDFNDRDGNALYTIFYYDGDGVLQSDQVRIDQSPKNTGGDTYFGARWVKLGNSSYSFVEQSGNNEIVIPVAHYYTWNDTNDDKVLNWNDTDGDGFFDYGSEAATEDVYLVTIPGSGRARGNYRLHYYHFEDTNANNRIEDGELREVLGADIPTSIIPQMVDEKGDAIVDSDELAYTVRQNFADWFSFYRRRILTAKAAVGLTVYDMERVELGVHTINRTYHEPLAYIADGNSVEMVTYLQTIYDINPSGSTPLRRGLHEVGKYFEKTDTGDYTNLKTSEGLCSGDDSVYYDANKDSDADTCDDAGGECQKAYVIAMTDGYYNGSFDFDSYGSTGFNDNVDGSSTYMVLRDGASNALADISMYFYNKDLDTNLDNKLPAAGYDDATYQHMVTYAVSFGVFGRFDPSLFPDCLPGGEPGEVGSPLLSDIGIESWTWSGDKVQYVNGAGPFAGKCPDWHDSVSTDSPNSVDDLFHASVNGRGEFLNAANPAELVTAMQTIKQLIDDQQGTAATVAVNAQKIQEDTVVFQTTFDSGDWSGDVLGICLDNTGNVAACDRVTCEASCNSQFEDNMKLCPIGDEACEISMVNQRITCLTDNSCADNLTCGEAQSACIVDCAGNAACEVTCNKTYTNCLATDPPERKWSASKQLDTKLEVSGTVIVPVGAVSRNIITAQADGSTGVPFTWSGIDASMQAILGGQPRLLDYLRGAHQYEAKNDTGNVHNYRNRSSRLGDLINSEPFYYKNTTLGIDWVFAGANDGMLHAFDSQTGDEIFAFIPNAVFANLPDLSESGYADNHKFYVDGYITVKDLGDSVVLVGGLGKGGKGFYALNLTAVAQNIDDIEGHADEIVLWEYTDKTQALTPGIADNLGYSFSRPQFIDPSTDTAASYLVFGNGYTSVNQRAVLFLVGLDSNGTILSTRMIDTDVGDATECNGLSTPAVLYPQGDGEDDYIYAGDLLGNLWKFDVSDDDPDNWEIYFNNGTVKKPLFTAMSVAGYRQPITMKPAITLSCDDGRDGYLVVFGTGRLLDPVFDAPDTSVQSVYGIWDWSRAWEVEGYAHPEQTWLGSFEQQNNTTPATCISTCDAELGDADTLGSCIYSCNNLTDCEEECALQYTSCTSNCSAIRNISNMGSILGDSSSKYVSLLRQTQVYVAGLKYAADGSISEQVYGATDLDMYDKISRVMSNNEISWLEPSESAGFIADSTKTVKHVGWYFDLPVNGERVIHDMDILNYKLVYTSSVPSDSPCESGGVSHLWAVDVCSGGRTGSPFFDSNGDEQITNNDFINIGTEANPEWVPGSSTQDDGLTGNPKIVENDNGLDVGIKTGEDGLETVKTPGFNTGNQYWHEINWQ
jgi:type IV pilus assembly protein PilY1